MPRHVRPEAAAPDDRRIARAANRAVISVAAAQGVVTLHGVVPTFALGEIEGAVWSIPGITRIDNQLQVA